eukprot:TRINITY_DN2033_c2_g1_i3.p1 TRINITY_DN2033_c2_g1~~TRINITY_DN2033_c2_g1_i3.p1  ORF type:complete len:644 (+),score=91.86 TRINITY_DN2033_c2_g1_i3:114-2045(+)
MPTGCRQVALLSTVIIACLLFYEQTELAQSSENESGLPPNRQIEANSESSSSTDVTSDGSIIDDDGLEQHQTSGNSEAEEEIDPPTLLIRSSTDNQTNLSARSEVLTKLHQEGWELFRSMHMKESNMPYEDRDIVEQICNQVGDEEDKWMCRKRGRRLAIQFKKYYIDNPLTAFNRNASETQWRENPEDSEGHILLRVVNGTIHSFKAFPPSPVYRFFDELIINRLVQVRERGGLHDNQTFDLIVVYGDACQSKSYKEFANQTKWYPTVAYSNSKRKCPHRIIAPWIDMIQDLTSSVSRNSQPAWSTLKDEAVFRGTSNNKYRVNTALLSAIHGRKFIDAGLTDKFLCSKFAEQLGNSTEVKANHICNVKGLVKKPLSWLKMRSYRYLISIDGFGAPLRFEPYLAAPGVVLRVGSHYLQGLTTTDIVPYVHYVPITTNITDMKQSFTESLYWLRSNQAIARNISAESTRWARKHATERAKNQLWAIIFALHSRYWKGGELPSNAKKVGPITCQNIKKFSTTKYAKKSINKACSWDNFRMHDVISAELLDFKTITSTDLENARHRFTLYSTEQLKNISIHGTRKEKYYLSKFSSHRMQRPKKKLESPLARKLAYVLAMPVLVCLCMLLIVRCSNWASRKPPATA